jgi:rhodanese-related sulfurtransferase
MHSHNSKPTESPLLVESMSRWLHEANWVLIYNAAGILAILSISIYMIQLLREPSPVHVEMPFKADLGRIKPDVAFDLLQHFPDTVLVDVRTMEAWDRSQHIEGAKLLPLEDLEARADVVLPNKHSRIILMSEADDDRSSTAGRWLIEQGYTHVLTMESGLQGWLDAQLPLQLEW